LWFYATHQSFPHSSLKHSGSSFWEIWEQREAEELGPLYPLSSLRAVHCRLYCWATLFISKW